MRFTATPIVGDTRVVIGIAGVPGTVAYGAQGNLGRELVRLANLQLEREETEGSGVHVLGDGVILEPGDEGWDG